MLASRTLCELPGYKGLRMARRSADFLQERHRVGRETSRSVPNILRLVYVM